MLNLFYHILVILSIHIGDTCIYTELVFNNLKDEISKLCELEIHVPYVFERELTHPRKVIPITRCSAAVFH